MPRRPTVVSWDWDSAYTEDSEQLDHDEQLLGYADHLNPGRVLDFGCGTGANSVELARRGWSVVGVDLAAKAIEIARAATSLDLDVAYEVGDMTTWRTDQPFDLVLISYALPSEGPQRTAAFSNASGSLASGGTLIVGEFEADSMSWGKGADFATVDGISESMASLNLVSVESVPTQAHDHDGKTSHDHGPPPRAVIGVATKSASGSHQSAV